MKQEKKFNPNEWLIDLPQSRKNKETGQWEKINQKYLPVNARILWMRSEHPDWQIITKPIKMNDDQAIYRTKIINDEGKILATATKNETKIGFGDFIEKAETGSVGRALALCGYGTQFAPELNEGDRLADAPVDKEYPAEDEKQEQVDTKDIPF